MTEDGAPRDAAAPPAATPSEAARGPFRYVTDELRAVIHAHCARALPDGDFAGALRRAARAARSAGLEPQQLVIAVKTAWYSLPDAERRNVPAALTAPGALDPADPIQWVVTQCIVGYYDER